MKIWIAEISDFLPKIDGDNRLYRAGMLAKAFVDAEHEVLWWSSTFNHQLRKQRFDVSTTIEIEKNFRLRLLYGLGYGRSISFGRWRHNRAVAKEFAREIAATPIDELPDLIYACLPTLEVSEQAVLFGVRHSIPVVVDVRELWPDNYLTPFPMYLRPILRLVLRNEFSRVYRILGYCTAITASSLAYLNWGLKKAKRQTGAMDHWFPLGFSGNAGDYNAKTRRGAIRLPNGTLLPEGSLLVTYVGTFTNLFNYASVLDAARKLYLAGLKQVQFIFVGNGNNADFLRKQSAGLENFHLTGWLEKRAIDEILSVSSIGLAPYMMEIVPTLSNKPFEYMASGLPILSSLGGELEDIIRQESIGLQYRCGDSDDLKRKIMWFLSHPEETAAMGQRAKTLFEEKYNADVVYPSLVNHLTKIASGRY